MDRNLPQWSNFPSAIDLLLSSKHRKLRPKTQTRAARGPAAQCSHRRSNKRTSPGRHLSIIKSSIVWTFGTRTRVRTSSALFLRWSIAHFHHTKIGIDETAAPAPIFFRTRIRFAVKIFREVFEMPSSSFGAEVDVIFTGSSCSFRINQFDVAKNPYDLCCRGWKSRFKLSWKITARRNRANHLFQNLHDDDVLERGKVKKLNDWIDQKECHNLQFVLKLSLWMTLVFNQTLFDS